MITCPSCNHQNPEGSLQCENCYTPLPTTSSCPNCGASVQTDATFCGQCGFNLQAENFSSAVGLEEETAIGSLPNISLEEVSQPDELPVSRQNPDILPETAMSSPIQSPWDDQDDQDDDSQTIAQNSELPFGFPEVEQRATNNFVPEPPDTQFVQPVPSSNQNVTPFPSEIPDLGLDGTIPESVFEPSVNSQATGESSNKNQPPAQKTPAIKQNQPFSSAGMSAATQLQIQRASLLHLQSNTTIEIPSSLDVVHFGKPNGHIPPDIDVSGYPDSEVVSRVHADIRIEGDTYYVEDTGSSNGTYVNHAPLQKGNRHRLRTGDRIALGKGDLVTFIFQLS